MNFVSNKIVCSKAILEKYFIDDAPFGKRVEEPYISLRKIFDLKIDDGKIYGSSIDYGWHWKVNEIGNEQVEILFETRRYIPILAIVKLIGMCRDVVWYCVFDGDGQYYRKFFFEENQIREAVFIADNHFDEWYEKDETQDLWEKDDYYLLEYFHLNTIEWTEVNSSDLIGKYLEKY